MHLPRPMTALLLLCWAALSTACAHLPPPPPPPQIIKVRVSPALMVCGPFNAPPEAKLQSEVATWANETYPRAIACANNMDQIRQLQK